VVYAYLHFHYRGEGLPLMNIAGNCGDGLGLEDEALPFEVEQAVRSWQQVTQKKAKEEWDYLQEWARNYKAWSKEAKQPAARPKEGGHEKEVWAKAASRDCGAYPYALGH
jgi:hypothetical protein